MTDSTLRITDLPLADASELGTLFRKTYREHLLGSPDAFEAWLSDNSAFNLEQAVALMIIADQANVLFVEGIETVTEAVSGLEIDPFRDLLDVPNIWLYLVADNSLTA